MDSDSTKLTYSTVWGQFNARDASTRITSQVVKGTTDDRMHNDKSIMALDAPHRLFSQTGNIPSEYSHTSGFEEHGMWHRGTYLGIRNSIVLIKNNWTRDTSPYLNAAMAILLYPTGPFLQVDANIVPHFESVRDSVIVFSGYGHVMTRRELRSMGVDLPTRFIRTFMDKDEIEEGFHVETVKRAAEAAPKIEQVQGDDGQEKTVITPGRRRRRMFIK